MRWIMLPLMQNSRAVIIPAAVLWLVFAVAGRTPAAEPPHGLQVRPTEIRLGGLNLRQQLQATVVSADGQHRDVTRQVQLTAEPADLVAIDGGVLTALRDGAGELTVTLDGVERRVAIQVSGAERFPPVDFRRDVVPLFAKLRCNSGGCHGKASGQNGFKLSVFGFDPRADYEALVHQGRGRRIFRPAPERSLLLTKAAGVAAHGGGRRTEVDSTDYRLLLEWIRQGSPWGRDDVPRVEAIRVEPADRSTQPLSEVQLLVTARYSDGSTRDVTAASTYTSNLAVVADVDQQGRVSVGELTGEAAITINYMGQVAVSRVRVPRASDTLPQRPVVENRLDQLVWDRLQLLGIPASEVCDDATFVRRAYTDAIGTLPEPAEVRAFLKDTAEDKRLALVDRLLERPEYADYWAQRWADVLLVDRKQLGERGAFLFHQWLRKQLTENRPYDEWVGELLTASGNSAKYGPVNFYRAATTSEELARSVSQALLGIRLDCAQCHHHPFDRWGQQDFYGLAGYFNGLRRETLAGERQVVFHAGYQPATLPLTGEKVAARPPGGAARDLQSVPDPRQVLADWVTAADNPYFARLAVNRLWKHYLGRGLVEPVDDLRLTNPASNEPLLDELSRQFVEDGYDLKRLSRRILQTRVYQLSSQATAANGGDEQNYSHFNVKRLPASVLLDAICQVTGVPEHYAGMPDGTRAIQLWDNRFPSYFLDTFGRSPRESPCECGASGEPTMSQALHLMNAPEIERKLSNSGGRIARLLQRDVANAELVEELCLAALGRLPGEAERKVAETLFDGRPRREAAEDFLWALLNSYDFLFVH